MLESTFLNALVTNGIAALAFVAVVGLLKEPMRQKSMAIMVAMAGGIFAVPPYAIAGFAVGAVVAVMGYLGLRSYVFIGIGWLIHAGWDTVLHVNGHGLVGLGPASSLGCAIFDPMIALWFFMGAPTVWPFARSKTGAA